MRVLHIISAIDPVRGGPINAMGGLAEALQRAGCEAAVAATWIDGESDQSESLRRAAVLVQTIGPAATPLRRHRDLAATVDRMVAGADVVHIHALWEEIQYLAAKSSVDRGKPYLITPHGMLDPWSLRQSRWKKFIYMHWRLKSLLSHAAAIHYTSEAERDGAMPLRLSAPAIVEPLGIDLAEFESLPDVGSFRRKHPQFAGRQLIVFLGRVHRGKGLELLVPALAKAGLEAALAIVGPDDDNYQREVELEVDRLNLRDRVVFTGMLRGAERIAALVDADLFALPSFHENFGIVVIEALACGVPVIISDEVNIHREIARAKVGAVVPTQIAPLSRELKRWLEDDSLRADSGRRARQFALENYGWNRIALRFVAHYGRLIRDRSLPTSQT